MTKLEAAKKALEKMHCDEIECNKCAACQMLDFDSCKARRIDGHVPTARNDGLDENGIKFFADYIKEDE